MEQAGAWLTEAIVLAAKLLALWLLLALFAWPVRWVIERTLPDGVTEAFLRLWRRLPGENNPFRWLSDRMAAVRQRVIGGRRVRTAVDHVHRVFDSRLQALRADLSRDLSVVAQGGAQGEQTLVGLLRGFDRASRNAHAFEVPDDELVDQSIKLSIARSRLFWSVTFSLIVGIFNFGLLSIFFRDVPIGIDIPGTRTDAMIILAFVLPMMEFGAGYLTALNAEEGSSKSGLIVTKVLIGGLLAVFEAYIFYLLFNNIAENLATAGSTPSGNFDFAVVAPYVAVAIAVAMVLFQVQAGDGAGRNRRRIKEMKPIQSLKDQLANARSFIDKLPERLSAIDSAAARARNSVRDFLAAVESQNDLDAPIVDRLGRARDELVDAVNAANPQNWPTDGPAADGDADDALRISWAMPVVLVLAPLGFTLLAGWLFAALPILQNYQFLAYTSAIGLALAAFLIFPGLAPRTALVVDEGRQVRRWLPAGGDRERWFAISYAILVVVVLLSVGGYVRGLEGALVAGLAVALLAPAAWIGGSLPQLLAGISFLAQAAVELVGFVGLLLWLVLRVIILSLLWLAAVLVNWAAKLLALPITLALHLVERRGRAANAGPVAP